MSYIIYHISHIYIYIYIYSVLVEGRAETRRAARCAAKPHLPDKCVAPRSVARRPLSNLGLASNTCVCPFALSRTSPVQ